MTSEEFQATIKDTYPDTLTLDQVRIILRISKRKSSWMLHNGYIKCRNNGKKTRQFQIDMVDLLDYIKRVEKGDPAICIPTGLFNARPAKCPRQDPVLIPPKYVHEKPPEDFADWLKDVWFESNDILKVEDIAELTGYTKQSVQKCITAKKLKAIWTQRELITSKVWLIDFYISEGYRIQNKCKKHIQLLMDYYKVEI